MSTFVIRRWVPGDNEELSEVFHASVRQVASRDYARAQIEAWASAPLDWHERMDKRIVWVAEADGRLVGFIQYDPPDHIDMTYVHPNHLRKGIASALLAALEAEARRCNVGMMNVEASITSKPFFISHGYELLTPQVVRVRGQDFLNYRMMKRLS